VVLRAPRIGFVTCARWPDVSESDRLAQQALEARGALVRALPWNMPAGTVDGNDVVVLRSNWDYHFDVEGFESWLARAEASRVNLWNPVPLVRWNLTKLYLLDLAKAGAPVVPTVRLDEPAALPRLLAERGWTSAVVKPVVSASGHDTIRVTLGDARSVVEALVAGHVRTPSILQPFVPEIAAAGEWSLVFVDGAFTHAVVKRPAPGDFRVQSHFGGVVTREAPGDVVVAAARRVLAALPQPPLYARVDGIETPRGFLVMEIELNEPGLFFTHAPAAADVFAAAVLRRGGG
jgi:glutathione synthase/RimK-type ligase-like ATP-grasp enzyme